MNKHFPLKYVKFNQYKHFKSKWMTNEILLEIKQRDKLYREFHKIKPNTQWNHIKANALDSKVKQVRKLKREANMFYYNK